MGNDLVGNTPATHLAILQETVHPRSREVMRSFGRWCGITRDVIDGAVENVFCGAATGILVSGAQASGKDTIGPLVVAKAGLVTEHCRVAHAIRDEIDVALSAMRSVTDPSDAVGLVAGCLAVPDESAQLYVDLLFEAAACDVALSAAARTPEMRRVLQHHGAEARVDRPGYWVKIAYQTVFGHLAAGRDVHLTDGRFLTEIDAGRVSGLYCVRLFVPVDVRIARIEARDGLVPDEATLRHPGETAADGYWGVDLEIMNVFPVNEVVDMLLPRFNAHRERVAAS